MLQLDSLVAMMEKLVTSVESKGITNKQKLNRKTRSVVTTGICDFVTFSIGDCVDFLDTGENEQKIVMHAILDACSSTNIEIRLGGLVLLCNIATSCYELLEEYMDDIVPVLKVSLFKTGFLN